MEEHHSDRALSEAFCVFKRRKGQPVCRVSPLVYAQPEGAKLSAVVIIAFSGDLHGRLLQRLVGDDQLPVDSGANLLGMLNLLREVKAQARELADFLGIPVHFGFLGTGDLVGPKGALCCLLSPTEILECLYSLGLKVSVLGNQELLCGLRWLDEVRAAVDCPRYLADNLTVKGAPVSQPERATRGVDLHCISHTTQEALKDLCGTANPPGYALGGVDGCQSLRPKGGGSYFVLAHVGESEENRLRDVLSDGLMILNGHEETLRVDSGRRPVVLRCEGQARRIGFVALAIAGKEVDLGTLRFYETSEPWWLPCIPPPDVELAHEHLQPEEILRLEELYAALPNPMPVFQVPGRTTQEKSGSLLRLVARCVERDARAQNRNPHVILLNSGCVRSDRVEDLVRRNLSQIPAACVSELLCSALIVEASFAPKALAQLVKLARRASKHESGLDLVEFPTATFVRRRMAAVSELRVCYPLWVASKIGWPQRDPPPEEIGVITRIVSRGLMEGVAN
jgi:hypothetical protein